MVSTKYDLLHGSIKAHELSIQKCIPNEPFLKKNQNVPWEELNYVFPYLKDVAMLKCVCAHSSHHQRLTSWRVRFSAKISTTVL